ncbi:MAG: lysylphosphatidylglycerol synthase transmembrane domain-containing protein [Deltaproteobacteria bacterium]|jgi:uncharacterized protein (TIRG00374 family)|nr:lysylphosphatidylglycerol synthase transmembrane domain-containing protein [Deltaproteobacteria bacterium]
MKLLKNPNLLKYSFKLIGVGILVYILHQTGWEKPLELAAKISPFWLFLILALNLPHIMMKARRWQIMLARNQCSYSFLHSLRAYFGGIALGIVTPGRTGEFLRAIFPVKTGKISMEASFASVIADRLFDLSTLALLSFLALFIYFNWKIPVLILLVILATFILIISTGKIWKRLLKKIWKLLKIKPQKRLIFKQAFMKALKNPPRLILLTLAGYLILNLQVYIMAREMGTPVSFLKLMLLFSLANTFALLPVSISGLGTREAALGYLFTLVGFNKAQGVTVALGFFFLVSLPVILTGSLTLLFSSQASAVYTGEDPKNGDNP